MVQGVFIGDYTGVALGSDLTDPTHAGRTSVAIPGHDHTQPGLLHTIDQAVVSQSSHWRPRLEGADDDSDSRSLKAQRGAAGAFGQRPPNSNSLREFQ